MTTNRTGSALGISFIGVADMDRSLEFYRDVIGLTVTESQAWSGESLVAQWQSPTGMDADAVLATYPGSRVGRVMLIRFHAETRLEVRAERETTWIGLGNLNFYNNHIHDTARRLSEAGYRFWSRPTTYEMSKAVGSPTEVVFEAPDSVPVNLVQLVRGTRTQTGDMAAFLDSHGMTPTGFTQVTTSAHYVRDMDAAVEFHQRVLGMEPLIDEILDRPEQNNFLSLPEDARTRVLFVKGRHMFGKVALCAPLNYECVDLTDRAEAPNIGYLAMGFDVPDLDEAVARADELGSGIVAAPRALDLPHLGSLRGAVVRAAGSGARYHLYEVAP